MRTSAGIEIPENGAELAYRPDIRERLQGVANEMHLLQRTSVALVADELVNYEWSEPVQWRAVREQDGIVSIEMRVVGP